MDIIKTFRVMLLPNQKQQTKLFQYAGAARFAYNWALEKERNSYQTDKKFLSDGELRKAFTQLKKDPEYAWLRKISNNVTKQAIKDACNAYKKFFKGLAGFPKFKSRKRSTPSFYQDNVKIRLTDTHVKMEGFADSGRPSRQNLNWIRLAEHGRIPANGKIMNPRIKYDGLHWFLTVSMECEDSTAEPANPGMGIDLGINNLAFCSDGNTYININKSQRIRALEKRKRRLQRAVARKYEINKEGERYCKTRNIVKSEKKLLKLNHRLTNIRHDHLHQTTSEIVKRDPSFICLPDLNVSGMMKNRHLARAVQQQSLREFRRLLEYKSAWHNIRVIVADRFYPSSKLCCRCGQIKRDLKLSDRVYECACGNVIDRDYQASLNLKRYGETVLEQSSA